MTYNKEQLQLILEGWRIVLDKGDENPNAQAENGAHNMNSEYVYIKDGDCYIDQFSYTKAICYLAIGVMGRNLSKSDKAQEEMNDFVNLVRE